MRAGLRPLLLAALGGLFALAFIPLFFAVASLTRATLRAEREAHAKALGRVVAARVSDARQTRAPGELVALVDAQTGGTTGIVALGVYDDGGVLGTRAGDADTALALPGVVVVAEERAEATVTRFGPAVRVTVPSVRGAVVVIVRTDDEATRAQPLLRLVGAYTAALAVALLLFVYILVGRVVVRPVGELSRAARRVADGARTFDAPRRGATELVELGASVALMTTKLCDEEAALRDKIVAFERATDERDRAQAELVRAERLASVGRLSAGLAHEVGNPLAAIVGLLDLLADGGLTEEESRDFVQRMRKEAERISGILRGLLDFARPARGGGPEAPGSLPAAIGDVLGLLRPQKALRDVDLAIDIDDDLPDVALSHAHIVQVLLNLVLNAADATGEGGHVLVRAARVARGVELIVEDDGPGIDAAVASSLFEPFVSTKDVGHGTGLGLAVCRGLVEGAAGQITGGARKDGKKGARFVVSLPVANA